MKIIVFNSGIEQPEDRGILLKDILEKDNTDNQGDGSITVPEATKKGYSEAKVGEGLDLTFPNSKTRRGRLMKYKSNCLTAQNHEMGVVQRCIQVGEADIKGNDSIKRIYSPEGKAPTMTTCGGGHREPKISVNIGIDRIRKEKKDGKASTLTATYYKGIRGVGRPFVANEDCIGEHIDKVRPKSKTVRTGGRGSYDRHEWDSVGNKDTELYWRKLTPLECERLMTLPDNYTATGINEKGEEVKISNTQRYKMCGNGWVVEVIKHIYGYNNFRSNTLHQL